MLNTKCKKREKEKAPGTRNLHVTGVNRYGVGVQESPKRPFSVQKLHGKNCGGIGKKKKKKAKKPRVRKMKDRKRKTDQKKEKSKLMQPMKQVNAEFCQEA